MNHIYHLSLKDFLTMIKRSWINLFIFSAVGFIVAFIYSIYAPTLFLAKAEIRLHQVKISGYEWASLDEPNAFVARIKNPDIITEKTLGDCGYDSGEEMLKKMQFSILDQAPVIIRLSLKNRTPDLSRKCLLSYIDDIKIVQKNLESLRASEYRAHKNYYINRIKQIKTDYSVVAGQKNPDLASEVALKAEIEWLVNKVSSTDAFLAFGTEGSVELNSPISVGIRPVQPKKFLIMLSGAILGLCIGLLVSFLSVICIPRLKKSH